MESDGNLQWDLKMPVLLDCLRKDICTVVSKFDLPEEEHQRVAKLVDQLRVEELKYEDNIKSEIQRKMGSMIDELKQLRETCITQREELAEFKKDGISANNPDEKSRDTLNY